MDLNDQEHLQIGKDENNTKFDYTICGQTVSLGVNKEQKKKKKIS